MGLQAPDDPDGADAVSSPNATMVIRAPPNRSATMPPSGRDSEPTRAPRNASEMVTSGNWLLSRVGNALEYPMNEPKVPM